MADLSEREEIDYLELLGDLHSGLSPANREKIVQLMLQEAQDILKRDLFKKCNRLPEKIQANYLKPGIPIYLAKLSETKQVPSRELLIFLQNLSTIPLEELGEVLEKTNILPRISPDDLLYIYPMATFKGPVRSRLLEKMPIKEWFSLVYYRLDRPITICVDYIFPRDLSQREDFIKCCSSIKILSNTLLYKASLFLTKQSVPLVTKKSKSLDLTLALDRDRDMALSRDLALDRALAVDLARTLDRNLAPDRERDLALVLAQARDRARNLVLNGIRDRFLAGALERPRVLALAGNLAPLPPRSPMGHVKLFFSGDDKGSPEQIPAEKDHLQLHPFITIYNKLALLIMGRGDERDWLDILRQTKTIQNSDWIKENIPFMKEDEVNEAIKLLNLGIEEDAIFEADWFKKGHPYAEGLTAKPSEFKQCLDEVLKKLRGWSR